MTSFFFFPAPPLLQGVFQPILLDKRNIYFHTGSDESWDLKNINFHTGSDESWDLKNIYIHTGSDESWDLKNIYVLMGLKKIFIFVVVLMSLGTLKNIYFHTGLGHFWCSLVSLIQPPAVFFVFVFAEGGGGV